MIDANQQEIPEHYNANIIRLRDYRLGTMINQFHSLCEETLHIYREAWKDYYEEYNKSIPEDFSEFWYLKESITIDTIFPKFVDLIDPISMNWIDMEYEEVSYIDGIYRYNLQKPIMTSDTKFLYPDTDVTYENHEPNYVIGNIYEAVREELREYLPTWLIRIESLYNELTYTSPKENETEAEFIKRTKRLIREQIKESKNK